MKSLRIAPIVCCMFLLLACICKAQKQILMNGFAHNDYGHKHPLRDALSNGYTHIEADVHLYKGELIVAHIHPSLHRHRTLESLYLKPLLDSMNKNGGWIYPAFQNPITLMIDVKSGAKETYAVLKPLLEKYSSLISGYENGHFVRRPVMVVLSGHKPYELLANDSNNRLCFIDEDLRKIQQDTVTGPKQTMYPMASCRYSKMLKWKGDGTLPASEKRKLCMYVKWAHHCGAQVRLWHAPENQTVWAELLRCGVDLINTNKLVSLRKFLVSNNEIYTDQTPARERSW